MIELTRSTNDDLLYINPNHVAAIDRIEGTEETQVILAIAGPKDIGPIAYRVKESPEIVWQKCVQDRSMFQDRLMRDLAQVMKQ